MPEAFSAEQQAIHAVEEKAQKENQTELTAELAKNQDIYYNQVSEAGKLLTDAGKLSDPEAKKDISDSASKIHNSLSGVAEKGREILKQTDKNADKNAPLASIESMSNEARSYTESVKQNVPFYQQLEKANTKYKAGNDALKAAEDELAKNEKADPVQLKKSLDDALAQLGANGAVAELKLPGVPSPAAQQLYDKLKLSIDTATAKTVSLQAQYIEKYEQNLPNTVKRILDVQKSPKQTDYTTSLEQGDKLVQKAAQEQDDSLKKDDFSKAGDSYSVAQNAANDLLQSLSKIDPKDIPDEYKNLYAAMRTDAETKLAKANEKVLQIQREQDSLNPETQKTASAALDAAEKGYEQPGEKSPKLSYEKAKASMDALLKNIKDNDDVAFNDQVKKDVGEGLNNMAGMKGQLMQIDRKLLSKEDQAKFDTLSRNVDSQLSELRQFQILISQQAAIDGMKVEKKKEPNPAMAGISRQLAEHGMRLEPETEMRPLMRMVRKTVNGVTVIAVVPTDEYNQLSPKDKKTYDDLLKMAGTKVDLQISQQENLKEDKDWLAGQASFEQGNYAQAKSLLLAYYKKFSTNPEKQLQASSAAGLLRAIVQMEFKQLEQTQETMAATVNRTDPRGGFDATTGVPLRITKQPFDGSTITFARFEAANNNVSDRLAAADKLVNSPDCPLSIEEVWKKVQDDYAGTNDAQEHPYSPLKLNGIDFNNPLQIHQLLFVDDPVQRKTNILLLARTARAAGLEEHAQKYFQMYFQDEIDKKKEDQKTGANGSEAINIDDLFQKNDGAKQVDAGVEDAKKDQLLTLKAQKMVEWGASSIRDWEDKGFDKKFDNEVLPKFESDFGNNKENIRKQVEAGVRESMVNQAARRAIHKDWKEGGAGDAQVWKEAYSGHFGVVENIEGSSLVFTPAELRAKARAIAIGLIITATTMGAASLAGGLVTGALTTGAEAGVAANAAGFVTEGLVMHSMSTVMNAALIGGGKLPTGAEFMKGLATTYATLGIMRGTNALYAGEIRSAAAMEGAAGTAARVGVAAEKTVVESGVLTGVSAGEQYIVHGKAMSGDDLIAAFGENVLTFTALGIGMHAGAGEGAETRVEDRGLQGDALAAARGEAPRAGDKEGSKAEGRAAETHFLSSFSRAENVPAEAMTEGGKTVKPENVAGWIDKDGQIHYNATYFEKEFPGVKMKSSEGGSNVFEVNGVGMSPKDFFKTEDGMKVLEEMKRVKDHEVTHRVLEVFNNQSGGKLGEKLQELASGIPELQTLLMGTQGKVDFAKVQEIMCQIADGRIKLSEENLGKIEGAMNEYVPDFSFEGVRKIDTKMLANATPGELTRGFVDNMTTGDRLRMPGSRFDGLYIAGVLADGSILVSSADPRTTPQGMQAPGLQKVGWRDILIGTKHNGQYVSDISADGKVMLTSFDPRDPMYEHVAKSYSVTTLNEVLGAASAKEKQGLRMGDQVSVLNSGGDRAYHGFTITSIDPMTGEVTVSGYIDGRPATKSYGNMQVLEAQVKLLSDVQRLPASFDLVNREGNVEGGWSIANVDIASGEIILKNIDGRIFNANSPESVSEMVMNTETIKEAKKNEILGKISALPKNFPLMLGDGKIYDGFQIESVDEQTGKITIKTADGRLSYVLDVDNLEQQIGRTVEMLRQPGAPAVVRQAPAMETQGVEAGRNNVKLSPEEVPRSSEVLAVGDLHGNYEIFRDSLKALGLIPPDGSIRWTGGNKKLVFHGDILADRQTGSLQIMEGIRQLQAMAAKEGGSVSLIAGNHEDFAVSFLAGKPIAGGDDALSMCMYNGQGNGIMEFMRFASNPDVRSAKTVMELAGVDVDLKTLNQDILQNMRKDPEGRKILEQMASMKVADYINDSLYTHTDLTPDIVRMFESNGSTVGQSVDSINARYQQGLRFLLLGEGSMPPDFLQINDTFTNTDNRDYFKPKRNPKTRQMEPAPYQPGQLKWLNDRGVNYIFHGHSHSDVGSNITTTPDGVKVIDVDHSAGKGGGGAASDTELSIGRVGRDGQFSNQ